MSGKPGSDPILTWGVLVGILCGGLFGMWGVTHKHTGPALMAVKQYELLPLTFISKDAHNAYNRIAAFRSNLDRNIGLGNEVTYAATWQMLVTVGKISGRYYRYPVGLILGLIGCYVLWTQSSSRFKNKYGLESLMVVQAKTWPVISPILKFNPAKANMRAPGSRVPLELPPFAEALYPEEWMAYHRIRIIGGVPDRDQIRRALLPQLGDRFEGIDNLPEHLYCLLAAFALKGAQKRKESDTFLGEIATCWSVEHGFVATSAVKSKAARTLNDKKIVEPLLEIMSRHAYVTTAFLGVLFWARRQGGVLAPAQFVWLRAENRELWYPLNNLGRRAFHVEATGAIAHYQAEIDARRPLTMPRLDAAVVAIVQYMSETRPRIPEIEGGEVRSAEKKLPGGRPDALMLAKPAKK